MRRGLAVRSRKERSLFSPPGTRHRIADYFRPDSRYSTRHRIADYFRPDPRYSTRHRIADPRYEYVHAAKLYFSAGYLLEVPFLHS